jgi:hypothetical protein
MNPLLLIALFGGGLLLLSRSNDSRNASPGGQSKELLTDDALNARFEKNLAAFAAGAPYFDKEQQAEARSSFMSDDDRDRAIAMAEFAVSGVNAGGEAITISPAAQAAAARLAVDYRDKFELREGKGALADAVIAASVALAKRAMTNAKAWSEPDATKEIDAAMVKLLVSSPAVAMIAEPIAKKIGVYKASFGVKEQTGAGLVSVGTMYQLMSDSMKSSTDGRQYLAYISKVNATEAGENLNGRYLITFAPAAAV